MKVVRLTQRQHDLLKDMLDSAIGTAEEEGDTRVVDMRGVWHACAAATTEPAETYGAPEVGVTSP